MAMMKNLAEQYAECYCIINSLDIRDEHDWEMAMNWVHDHSFKECRKYIEVNW